MLDKIVVLRELDLISIRIANITLNCPTYKDVKIKGLIDQRDAIMLELESEKSIKEKG